jgi:adenylylsulfate kinase-like enzyme
LSIRNFVEPPLNPEVVVHSASQSAEESANRVWAKLEELGLISF